MGNCYAFSALAGDIIFYSVDWVVFHFLYDPYRQNKALAKRSQYIRTINAANFHHPNNFCRVYVLHLDILFSKPVGV